MSKMRVIIETEEENPTFDGCLDSDVAAEAIYMDWLRPLVNVILPGAKVIDVEIEGNESVYRLFEVDR